ncbi:VanZ family protein [Metabacillus malikii]|uniref:Glycopeptide antibiotics resistance protein n=1 Tax=Metabacillus malikii TaxID=1504265 RepID=A0ABT9ZLF9_9BACI|nr:VanZ family protein [Metabacillus malikii]MDQ0232627.1 glycopeptide antibiotics resistance protein [Metabacillus malikii]
MTKYILLVFPLIFYGESLWFYYREGHVESLILEVLLHFAIISICMIFLLKRTRLQNVFDWFIGICFTVYFCILYQNTVEYTLYLENAHYSLENLSFIVHSVNLLPIKGMIDVIRYSPDALFQIIGNLIMLTPFAFAMLYFKWANSAKQTILYSFLCTTGIEIVQLVQSMLGTMFDIGMGRSTDIDDVILNTTGAAIGIGCYFLWRKIEQFFSGTKKKSYVANYMK